MLYCVCSYLIVLVPFYRGAVVFEVPMLIDADSDIVLVPFYRGAVVFKERELDP